MEVPPYLLLYCFNAMAAIEIKVQIMTKLFQKQLLHIKEKSATSSAPDKKG